MRHQNYLANGICPCKAGVSYQVVNFNEQLFYFLHLLITPQGMTKCFKNTYLWRLFLLIKSHENGVMHPVSLKVEQDSVSLSEIFIHHFKNFERVNFVVIDLVYEVPALEGIR